MNHGHHPDCDWILWHCQRNRVPVQAPGQAPQLRSPKSRTSAQNRKGQIRPQVHARQPQSKNRLSQRAVVKDRKPAQIRQDFLVTFRLTQQVENQTIATIQQNKQISEHSSVST